jgi:hypothetical protein
MAKKLRNDEMSEVQTILKSAFRKVDRAEKSLRETLEDLFAELEAGELELKDAKYLMKASYATMAKNLTVSESTIKRAISPFRKELKIKQLDALKELKELDPKLTYEDLAKESGIHSKSAIQRHVEGETKQSSGEVDKRTLNKKVDYKSEYEKLQKEHEALLAKYEALLAEKGVIPTEAVA